MFYKISLFEFHVSYFKYSNISPFYKCLSYWFMLGFYYRYHSKHNNDIYLFYHDFHVTYFDFCRSGDPVNITSPECELRGFNKSSSSTRACLLNSKKSENWVSTFATFLLGSVGAKKEDDTITTITQGKSAFVRSRMTWKELGDYRSSTRKPKFLERTAGLSLGTFNSLALDILTHIHLSL